ncbi:DUF4354 family protein [Serratia ureilytica]|uniref:DUF4354 family protein n=1 Tax=Serratia ureilytica TaxID=300181 RepID=UPI0034C686CE
MKSKKLICIFLVMASFVASAKKPTEDIAVYAKEINLGSISIGDNVAYTKSFEVVLVKLSGGVTDLSKLCLSAFTSDGMHFQLDTIDENLVIGKLKPGKIVKGNATFSSDNDNVLKANSVKINENCE